MGNKILDGLVNSIETKLNQEHVTPSNEILIPIPKEHVDKQEASSVEFIRKIGKIGRDKNIPIQVDIEPKRKNHQGKTYETVNFIIKFDLDLDIDKLKKEINNN